MKRYLVRLNQLELRFEEVSAKVFEKRQHALTDDGSDARYFFNEFIVVDENNRIQQLQLNDFNHRDLGYICRSFGQQTLPESKIEGGFIRTPTHIRFTNPRSKSFVLIEMATGIEYIQKVA